MEFGVKAVRNIMRTEVAFNRNAPLTKEGADVEYSRPVQLFLPADGSARMCSRMRT